MDKPAVIRNPPTKVKLNELTAELKMASWYSVLAESLGDAFKVAVDAGMPSSLAMEAYARAMHRSVGEAVEVRDRITKRRYEPYEQSKKG